MNRPEKSDPAIVASKPTNAAEQSGAEPGEPRAGTEGNARQDGTLRTPSREGASHGLDRVRTTARERKKETFTALLHHVDVAALEEAFLDLKRTAAPGVDGLTWKTYEADLGLRLEDLHSRVHRGAYRALPAGGLHTQAGRTAASAGGRRAGGQDRPTGDGDGAERDLRGGFPRLQLGFRPGRGAHDALDALMVGITTRRVNWILDADIARLFER